MITFVTTFWWMYALRGLFAILFGLAALFWPGLTLTVLIFLFGIYVLLQGVFLIFAAILSKGVNYNWWIILLEGAFCGLLGMLAFVWPGLTAIALLILIAIWLLMSGIFEVMAAIQLRKVLEGEWVLALLGVLSVLVAFILLLRPGAGALAVVAIIGFYAVFLGMLELYLAFKIRKLPDSISIQL